MTLFLTPSIKITSGEIIVKKGRGGRRQSSYWANKQQWTSQIKSNRIRQHIKTNLITSKVFFKNQNQKKRIIQFCPSIHQPNHHPPPHHTHPEERIWAGRTPPAEAPGPGRSEEWARYHMKIHTHKKCGNAKNQKHKIAKELENNA